MRGASTTGDGVLGFTSGPGAAVRGTATTGDGVVGLTGGEAAAGVRGTNNGAGDGVAGTSGAGAAVRGTATAGDGVVGVTGGEASAGVRGTNNGAGDGVRGVSNGAGGTAVRGLANAEGGTGIRAVAPPSGTAIEVLGVNRFSQAGRGTFEAGKRQVVIPNLLLTATSGILVTLNSLTGPGVFLQYARANPNTKRAVLQLSRPPKRPVKFTYFIVDEAVV